jgi:transposase
MDLWFLDEVHFQQYGSRCRMWVPPEQSDPVLWHHPTRRSVGYFGAVRLRDGKFVFQRETERFNTVTFHAFYTYLKRVSSRSGRHVVAIADNARYHHSIPCHPQDNLFRLDFLPPYSPDLNPIERVWKLIRRLCLHNRYFPLLDDVITAVETQFAQWVHGNHTLKRLCAIT